MKNLPTILLLVCYFLPVSASNYSNTSSYQVLPIKKLVSDPFDLSILSLNAWGLPINLRKYRQAERFDKIPDALNKADTDIICLQECFSESLRNNIFNNISNAYTYASDYSCNRRSAGILRMDCYGGLMTLSKYPIVEEAYYPFPELDGFNIIEKIGAKGFLLSRIDIGSQEIYVINTHLYSGHAVTAESIREKQVDYIWEMLVQLGIQKENIVLAGDLNFSHPKVMNENSLVSKSTIYNRLISEYGFVDGNEELKYTIDPISNKYCDSKDAKQILDYVMFRSTQNDEFYLSSKVVMNNDEAVSDHCGVLARLMLQPSIEPFDDEITTMLEASLK